MRQRQGVVLHGPYKHRSKWRVLRRAPGEPDQWTSFDDEAEARRFVDEARRRLEGRRVSEAIKAYVQSMEDRDAAEESLTFTRNRLRAAAPDPDELLSAITPARAKKLLAEVKGTVATRRETLKAARRWWRWLVAEGWTRGAPWDGLVVEGVRNRGKQQLGLDDSRTLYRWCLDGAAERPEGLAIVLAMLGCSASEIVGLVKRDLDDGGRVVHARGTKTVFRARRIQVPDEVGEALVAFADALEPDQRLWPFSRHWIGALLKRVCLELGLPHACPHALRGGAATWTAQATGDARLVGQLLGHGPRSRVAEAAYIAPGTIASHQADQYFKVLRGGRSG
jgi:integrase